MVENFGIRFSKFSLPVSMTDEVFTDALRLIDEWESDASSTATNLAIRLFELFSFGIIGSGSRITAKFEPKNIDDLQSGAKKFIGKSGVFEAMWIIEEGEYAGEWAMFAPKDWTAAEFAWVPLSDLRPVCTDAMAQLHAPTVVNAEPPKGAILK